MDPQISTSFIPKKPLTGERPRGNAFGFIMLIAILVFVVSGVAAGAIFIYGEIVLKASLESKKADLTKSQQAYDPGAIEELVRLDARINQARMLLDKHVAPSSIFMLLAEQTLEDVQFTSFDYKRTEDGYAEIHMNGRAADFSTVALQSDTFGSNKMLRDVVFSDIAIGEKGVTFAVEVKIDQPNLLYSKHLNQGLTVPLNDSATSTSSNADVASSTQPGL